MGRCRDDDAPVWAAVGAPVFCPYGVAVFTFLLHASVLKTFSATLMPLSGTELFSGTRAWGDVLQFMLEAIAHLVRPQCGEWKVLFAGNAFDRYTL